MTARRSVLLSLLLACAALQSTAAQGQTARDSACTYTRCALRVEHRFLSTRLVRGASGESVSRLGWFGSGIEPLLAGPDSAAYHARQYRSRRQTSDALGFASAVLAILAITQTDENFVEGSALLLTGAVLELVALPFWLGSRRSLDRSVWWYNRDLPRP